MDNMLGHTPATQPPVVIDSGNDLDDQQSQWSPEIMENPLSNHSVSTSDDGASTSVSTERSAVHSQTNQINYHMLKQPSSQLIRSVKDQSVTLLEN